MYTIPKLRKTQEHTKKQIHFLCFILNFYEAKTEIPEIGMVCAVFEDTEGNRLNVVGDIKHT
ncbi:hypothetical protein SAMN05421747_107158 [Parapedobacter composti]|uniref:Uncharacterized protein n=1 Tax=Parapedobacter composti TaxID=623281 RepID=A0A1I1HWS3_9SPHI|nr:hypothetical protein SAMN05421747_107158 [Parapedobacter composti]